ncbi:hypothetical protein QAD02_016878 [Eretmocerus hayati]|uniref:Uncharacterized protein n=1 Tax=Eretmocerus hayati TaxID=131215 RepID=A0ACC2PDL0_9HYME|nr:hypothetical protein QAD02_016878 [Eretmocerus hayati]
MRVVIVQNQDTKTLLLSKNSMDYAANTTPVFDSGHYRKNLAGESVYLVAPELPLTWIYNKKLHAVTGIGVDIWKILAEFYNFTLEFQQIQLTEYFMLMNPVNFTTKMETLGVKELIIPIVSIDREKHDAFDLSMELYKYGNRLYVEPARHFSTTWMLDIYSQKMWYLIGLFYMISSIWSVWIREKTQLKNTSKSFVVLDYLFYYFGIFCGRGLQIETAKPSSRIFLMSISVLSWFLLASFSSQIFVVMSHSVLIPPFQDLESLFYDTDYTILVHNHSSTRVGLTNGERPITSEILKSNRIEYFEDYRIMWERACSPTHRKAAIFQYDVLPIDDDLQCKLEPIGMSYFERWVAAGISKNSNKTGLINYGIIKLHEVGIMSYLVDQWLDPDDETQMQARSFSPISMGQLFLPVMIYVIGTCLSLFTLLLERIHHSNCRCYRWREDKWF